VTRALVAGIGNVFLGDDGFGVEVAARLSRQRLPEGVRVIDAGIRARDLAYELLEGRYETAILVDATARGGAPGTLYVMEPDVAAPPATASASRIDGHAMTPEAALALVQALGGIRTRVLVVGCEPASVEEGIGLSQPVAAAVDGALVMVRELLCA
jgi:hydrogenase maturation protease